MNKIIFQVLLIVVSVGLFFTVIDPMFTSEDPNSPGIKRLQAEMGQFDDAINNSREFNQEKKKLVEQKTAINPENIARLERLLPDSIDNIRLVININDIARPYGLVLEGLRFGGERAGAQNSDGGVTVGGNETVGSVTLGFSVNSDYDTFKRFLESLESSLRLADVTSITIRSGTAGNLSFDVTIKTYWLR